MIQSAVDQSRLNYYQSITVDFAFCHTWTSLIFSLYIFLNSGKSHRSSVRLVVPRSSASYSDSSSRSQNSRIPCIQQQGFPNKSSKLSSRHQHCNDIVLDQQHSCWNPNSSRIYLSDIVSNSWIVVQMELYRAYWIKCLIIDNSLCLWETSQYRSCFVFLDTSISCMFDHIDSLGSYHRLPLWSLNNILCIII